MHSVISVVDFLSSGESHGFDTNYFVMPFYFQGNKIPLYEACWGMTLLNAGSMRFRWNEKNLVRDRMLSQICGEKTPVAVELIHSKIVVRADSCGYVEKVLADGIVTNMPNLVPVVTVADCVPIFLFDSKRKVIASLHSGWKGTGIAAEGIRKMSEWYGSDIKDVCVAIGPHIGDCCYNIDDERADYFSLEFGSDAVIERDGKKFLSLTAANLSVLKKVGVEESNIVVASDCTCCTCYPTGKSVYGSFRREAAGKEGSLMTVQAAFSVLNSSKN